MKKLLLSLAAVALSCSAMSAADLLYNLEFGKDVNVENKYYPNNNGYTGTFDYTLTSNEVFAVANFNNNNNGWTDMIKCGRKGNASTGMITTNFKVPAEVTSVELAISKLNEENCVNSFSLETSSDNETWTSVATAKEDAYANGKVTLDVTAPASGLYYRISIDCNANASKANGVVWLTGVKYYGNWTMTGDKQPAGLAWNKASFTCGDGTKYFTDATLSNPNELAVTYSSSNPSVATYDGNLNVVKVTGLGSTVITATSAETDDFAAGEASFTLNVVKAAKTIADMLRLAPNKGDKVWMNGSLTVQFAYGNYVYVIDDDDQATLLYGANTYKTGDILAAGWVATNALYGSLQEWSGNFPEVETTMPETYMQFPTLTNVTLADVNKVAWINGVTFDAETPASKKSVTAKLADGTEIVVYNQFANEVMEAGTYNLKVAVSVYNSTVQVCPIEYINVNDVKKEPTPPEDLVITTDDPTAVITRDDQGDYVAYYVTATTTKDSVKIHIDTPEGFDALLILTEDSNVSSDDVNMLMRANAPEWIPASMVMAYGYQKGNTVTADARTYPYTEEIGILLEWDGKVDYANQYTIFAKISKDKGTVGVEAIEAAEAKAEYYTLQGVKVENPANGIFVKVVDGKASKIVL